jgi:uncharacterized membrane protein
MRIFILLALLLVPLVAAEKYYVDVVMDVSETGVVTVSGLTNHPLLTPGETQEFTSKSKDRWIFNVTINETIEDYVFTIILPPGANLNYVQGKNFQIATIDERVAVKVVGSDARVSIAAQYQLQPLEKKSEILWFVAVFLGALLIAGGMYLQSRKPRKTRTTLRLFDGFPARQQEIIAMLQQSGGQLTQKQIEQAMSIPKSSVSRNIDALVRRGVITKEQHGMTNILTLTQ